MKKVILIVLAIFVGTFVFAQQNVAFVRGVNKTNCGYSTDACYRCEYGKGNVYELLQSARNKLSCSSSMKLNDNKSNANYLIVISSSFKYEDGNCSANVYGFGAASNRTEALKQALKNIESNNWSWREKYGYKIEVDRSL
jgi:hypothetical protein